MVMHVDEQPPAAGDNVSTILIAGQPVLYNFSRKMPQRDVLAEIEGNAAPKAAREVRPGFAGWRTD
jgi:hypothetical protein